MPRSRRSILARPQLRAMSVALLDQGEMVPKRGMTRNSWPLGSCTGTLGPYFSSRASTCSSLASSRPVTSAKCANSAYSPVTAGTLAVSCESSLPWRKAERAGVPRRINIVNSLWEGVCLKAVHSSLKRRPAAPSRAPECCRDMAPVGLCVYCADVCPHCVAHPHDRPLVGALDPPAARGLRWHCRQAPHHPPAPGGGGRA